ALSLADLDYLAEPFLPTADDRHFTALQRHVEIRPTMREIKRRYAAWQTERIAALIRWLEQRSTKPDVIVFPECSIPFESLSALYQLAQRHPITVLAGTHVPRRESSGAAYKTIGARQGHIDRVLRADPSPTMLLPIFAQNRETQLFPKLAPSVFEKS